MQPCREGRVNRAIFCVIDADPGYLHREIGGFDDGCKRPRIVGSRRDCPLRISFLDDEGFIIDLQLVEVHLGQLQISCPVIPVQRDRRIVRLGKFLQGDMVRLLQLGVKLFGVGVVQIDQGRFGRVLIHLAQAAARGLQHHVLRAIAFLGENDAREAAAVPALLTDLNQQDDADAGEGFVQGIKLQLAVRWLRIAFISFVEPEYGVRTEAILGNDGGHERINHLFQLLYCSAVDAQLGDGAVLVNGVPIGVQEFSHTLFDDDRAFRYLRDLHPRAFQEVADAVDQRIVVYDVGDLSCGHR